MVILLPKDHVLERKERALLSNFR